jgi:hypothetical protein
VVFDDLEKGAGIWRTDLESEARKKDASLGARVRSPRGKITVRIGIRKMTMGQG